MHACTHAHAHAHARTRAHTHTRTHTLTGDGQTESGAAEGSGPPPPPPSDSAGGKLGAWLSEKAVTTHISHTKKNDVIQFTSLIVQSLNGISPYKRTKYRMRHMSCD